MLFARPLKPAFAALLLGTVLALPFDARAALPRSLPVTASLLSLTLPGTGGAGQTLLFTSPASSILPHAPSNSPMHTVYPTPQGLLSAWTPPGLGWLWNRDTDPSLHLSGWGSVFNIARLGAYAVPLRDDPAERANIVLAAQAVDSKTIMPGGTFSFNAIVGERTPERGFEDGLMFDQGQIVRGTGGGICLVSTGLYNAALQAGLTITERHGHSGVVTYAAPGCDASVVYGSEDMQFVNTTAQPIIIKTTIGQDQVLVSSVWHAAACRAARLHQNSIPQHDRRPDRADFGPAAAAHECAHRRPKAAQWLPCRCGARVDPARPCCPPRDHRRRDPRPAPQARPRARASPNAARRCAARSRR